MTDPRGLAKEFRVRAGTRLGRTVGVRLSLDEMLDIAVALERLAALEPCQTANVEELHRADSLVGELRARVEGLEAALRQWRCPRCAWEEIWPSNGSDIVDGVCPMCEGAGLHPVAAKALGRTEEP